MAAIAIHLRVVVRRHASVLWLLLALVLAGCVHPGQPVIAERSPVLQPLPQVPVSGGGNVRIYTVRKTDTLYSIAWRFQLEYRGFARANGIAPPYTIYPGQKLRLVTQVQGASLRRSPASTKPQAQPVPKPRSPRTASAPDATPKASPPSSPRRWVWPVSIKPRDEFSRQSKGMNFVVAPGQTLSVRVISAGEVVYAGNGIGGFEHLIIVKHTADLLSAYGFNGTRRISEGKRVKAGAVVADIVNTGRKAQTLHFEVRREGKPLNPRELLP